MELLAKLVKGKNLSTAQAREFIDLTVEARLSPAVIGGILVALSMKGETPNEIVGLILGMRQHMVKVPSIKGAVDTCGTGGDGSNCFNISTVSSLVVAGTGVKVAKHGNRAASSQCGSADVLEALGVNINLTPDQAQAVLAQVGLVFLFAPLFHPAMKQIAPIRKELKVRTVFNFLGPFLNPAQVSRQIIGVPNQDLVKKLSQVACKLRYEKVLLLSSEDHLDEASISAPTLVIEVTNNTAKTYQIKPEDFGLPRAGLEQIKGGDAAANARIIQSILAGVSGPKRDVVVLNSALALYAANQVSTIAQGVKLAQYSLDTGQAKKILNSLIRSSQSFRGLNK